MIQPILDSAASKFYSTSDDEKNILIDYINLYLNSYPFLSSISKFYDVKLEKLYIFLKHLIKKIKKDTQNISLKHVQSYVDLEDIKIQKKFEGQIK